MFEESGEVTTSTNRVVVAQLTPATMYRFRVSAITDAEMRGAEIIVPGSTTEVTGGRS